MVCLRENALGEPVCVLNVGCKPIAQRASERNYFTSLSFGRWVPAFNTDSAEVRCPCPYFCAAISI